MGNALGKILFAVAVTFIGVKIIKKKCPGLQRDVADKTRKVLNVVKEGAKGFVSAAGDAFRDGYTSARESV